MPKITVNGKHVTPAPLVLIVAPNHPVPDIPGYTEESRWGDCVGWTIRYRCDAADPMQARADQINAQVTA